MAYKIVDQLAGHQPISVVSTTKNHPLGTEVRVVDPNRGGGVAVYVSFQASTAVAAGLVCQWNAAFAAVALPVLATSKNTQVPLGVNITAVASSTSVQYGWLLIVGSIATLKTAVQVVPTSVFFASGTAGRVKVLTSAGGQILGIGLASATVTSTTSTVVLYWNRARMQGQIT